MCSVADPDPGSGAVLTPGSGIRDGYKIRIWDEKLGSYSESLETVLWVNILQFFIADQGSGLEKFGSGIRNGKNSYPGSGINIPDPQH
jgi:hypothetical protein